MGSRLIRRILIPNRGEIAIRIARTCREMGITAVIAHAEDDASSVAVRYADETISLGAGDARATYLDIGVIIDAARRCGADAIHPGYGFLSERAALAAACVDAGIVFIGPKASSIEMMGSKAESRRLMENLGVPVVPGYHGDDQSSAAFAAEGSRIGYPLLVKASAGGGGKGMKIVRAPGDLDAAIESAKREASKAFGDDRILIERYIENPRHVEFQILGDEQGNIVHLFERDCSIQRRHQKVIEESPAPRFPEETRAKMAASAIAAARGVTYVSAGTVEFILTPEGEHYFLEMNTRLQVEHPVTELILGIDLVRAQIAIAAGNPIPWTQDELRSRGHAIECRVYAEDPDVGFLPQSGTVRVYREPSGPGVRVDSGIALGTEIGIRYDPMLAKIIAFAETRETAIVRLVRALRETVILGTKTNVPYLRRVLEHPAFIRGEVDTHFLERHESELNQPAPPDVAVPIAAVLASVSGTRGASRGGGAAVSLIPSVWELVKE